MFMNFLKSLRFRLLNPEHDGFFRTKVIREHINEQE